MSVRATFQWLYDAHLRIAVSFNSQICISLTSYSLVCGVCRNWSYYRCMENNETGAHLFQNICFPTYGFRCHYSSNVSPAVLNGLHVCIGGYNLYLNELFTCAPSFHWPTWGLHEAQPLYQTPCKSMWASQSGVKIESRSKYLHAEN